MDPDPVDSLDDGTCDELDNLPYKYMVALVKSPLVSLHTDALFEDIWKKEAWAEQLTEDRAYFVPSPAAIFKEKAVDLLKFALTKLTSRGRRSRERSQGVIGKESRMYSVLVIWK